MSKEIQNLGTEILYQAPGAFALLFAGAAIYISEGDPSVREELQNTKQQLRHWAKMYRWGLKFMPILVVGGASTAVVAYLQSKEKIWLLGGATLFLTLPYTFFVMMKTNNRLNAILENSPDAEVSEENKPTVLESLKRWVNLHRVRGVLALGSAAIFFLAKQYTKRAA